MHTGRRGVTGKEISPPHIHTPPFPLILWSPLFVHLQWWLIKTCILKLFILKLTHFQTFFKPLVFKPFLHGPIQKPYKFTPNIYYQSFTVKRIQVTFKWQRTSCLFFPHQKKQAHIHPTHLHNLKILNMRSCWGLTHLLSIYHLKNKLTGVSRIAAFGACCSFAVLWNRRQQTDLTFDWFIFLFSSLRIGKTQQKKVLMYSLLRV